MKRKLRIWNIPGDVLYPWVAAVSGTQTKMMMTLPRPQYLYHTPSCSGLGVTCTANKGNDVLVACSGAAGQPGSQAHVVFETRGWEGHQPPAISKGSPITRVGSPSPQTHQSLHALHVGGADGQGFLIPPLGLLQVASELRDLAPHVQDIV